jgi:hypothetical protein
MRRRPPEPTPVTAIPAVRPLDVQLVPIDRLVLYDQNPRDNDPAVDAVAASIREFGWNVPIVCDAQWVIVAGHTRHKAARKLGLTEVPVFVAAHLTPAQARAYRIADNQTSNLSTWDDGKLALELMALQQLDFDLNLTGFSGDELTRLMAPEPTIGNTDPDDVPEPPAEAVAQPGDLWLLGRHRLLCGDSTDPAQVARLMNGHTARMMFTDPPWNVAIGQDANPRHRQRPGARQRRPARRGLPRPARRLRGGGRAARDWGPVLRPRGGAVAGSGRGAAGPRLPLVGDCDLGEGRIRPRPLEVPPPVRADLVRLASAGREFVRRPTGPGRRVGGAAAAAVGGAPDDEAGGAAGPGDREQLGPRGRRPRPVRRGGFRR